MVTMLEVINRIPGSLHRYFKTIVRKHSQR